MPGELAYRAHQFFLKGLDWLYPPDCGGCGKRGTRWCEECQSNSQVIGDHCCEICGNISVEQGLCDRCQKERPVCTAIRSWAVFDGPVRSAVHKLKYKGDFSLGASLAEPMLSFMQGINWPIDIVIPVPLSLARLSERGYNQAALIARYVAYGLNLPFSTKALHKVRDTRTQVGLQYHERQANVVGAFEANREYVSGKCILIVDDVTTSGSTLNACAKALINASSSDVYGCTFARAIFTHPNVDADVSLKVM